MAYENLIVTERAHTRLVTINRPKALNALNKKTLLELEQVIGDTKNSDLRALVITGSGDKSFVAGADISEMKGFGPLEAEAFSALGHRVFAKMGQLSIPVIAAVNGYALGGGLELALAADFIYAASSAMFGLVETQLGLIPGFGGCGRLVERVGVARAKEMVFSAAQITADEAVKMGLVNRVIQDGSVVDSALSIADKICERGPYANGLAKSVMNLSLISQAPVHQMEQKSFGLVFGSKDHAEGIRAFLDKRKPNFEGC